LKRNLVNINQSMPMKSGSYPTFLLWILTLDIIHILWYNILIKGKTKHLKLIRSDDVWKEY